MTTHSDAETAEYVRRLEAPILARAALLYEDDDSPQAEDLREQADAIAARRRQAHADAVAAGVTPCPAAWSKVTPCVNPAGDGHDGPCFSAEDSQEWPRALSWFTPESRPTAVPAPAGAAPAESRAAISPAGEVYGHGSAKRYTAEMAGAADAAVTSLEQTRARLTGGTVTGEALAHLTRAQEQATAMATALKTALAILTGHDTVAEAYTAAPDAGDKPWQTHE
jgi:hypothetical protein